MNRKYFVLTVLVCFLSVSLMAQKGKNKPYKNAPIDTTKFVLVMEGTYKMGTDELIEKHEGPAHEVTVKNFWIGKTEVSMEDYDKYCLDTKKDTVKSFGWGRVNRPAIFVSWDDAIAYCNWLSDKEKLSRYYKIDTAGNVTYRDTAKGYRLPTEAEWEFAARGGNNSKGYKYAGSNNLDEVGWYRANTGDKGYPMKQKAPNELGLYDMSGNMWEWVWDWYADYKVSATPENDPHGPATGRYRVMRGGAFYNQPQYLRIPVRQNSGPNFKQNSVGFRIARTYF